LKSKTEKSRKVWTKSLGKTFNSTLRSTEHSMTFSSTRIGQVGLSLVFSVLVASCNKEEFYLAEEFLVGEDAYCFKEGPDLASCLQLADRCQPSYLDSEDESVAPEFFVCLANPNFVPVDDGSSTTGGVDDGSTTGGVDDGSTTGGVDDGSTTGGTSGGSSAGGANGGSSAGGANGGSSAGGTDGGSTAGGSDDGSTGSVDPAAPPTIEETVAAKCSNLDAQYLWTKKIVKKNKETIESKVKVCHMTGNNSSHTIVIACPALKAHVKHHDDYIGACK
jgi:hypothetical protein